MTDRITRRSLAVATLAHAALVGVALFGGRLLPPSPAATPAPAVPPTPPPPPATELVLAPELAPPAPPTALPALAAADAPTLPGLPITAAGPTDLPELHDSAGKDAAAPAYRAEDLPVSTGRDDELASQLRAKHASESLGFDEEMKRDAVNLISANLRKHLRTDRDWRAFAERMTNRELVLQVEVDARRHITHVAMVRGTGIDEFDRRIVSWLENAGFGLPPIPLNHPLYPLVSLR